MLGYGVRTVTMCYELYVFRTVSPASERAEVLLFWRYPTGMKIFDITKSMIHP